MRVLGVPREYSEHVAAAAPSDAPQLVAVPRRARRRQRKGIRVVILIIIVLIIIINRGQQKRHSPSQCAARGKDRGRPIGDSHSRGSPPAVAVESSHGYSEHSEGYPEHSQGYSEGTLSTQEGYSEPLPLSLRSSGLSGASGRLAFSRSERSIRLGNVSRFH